MDVFPLDIDPDPRCRGDGETGARLIQVYAAAVFNPHNSRIAVVQPGRSVGETVAEQGYSGRPEWVWSSRGGPENLGRPAINR
jgi:hypothetical protein